MVFSIHQFSSGIKNPTKNRNGEWVSGGFGGEIANESYSVPEEIKKAVNTTTLGGSRGFGIPDAYAPPKPGEIALIARDLGTYCVLAVANLQKDEGDRRFIAYRYFWLDKTQFQNHSKRQDVDGIGTLLFYWQQNKQPQYNIGELQNNRISYTSSWNDLQRVFLFEDWKQGHSQRIQSLLSNIVPSQQPLIYEAAEIARELTWQEVHCLAIEYCIVNRGYVNWAWNVRKLQNTQGLNVIYCADAEAFQWFYKKFYPPVRTSTPAATSSLQEGITTTANHRSEASVNPSLKECLKIFRDTTFTEQDIRNLINSCQNYDEDKIFESADTIEINKFINESNPQNFAIQYATLVTALAPNKTLNILNKLIRLNQRDKWVAIMFLIDLKQRANSSSLCNHNYFTDFYYALTQLQDKLIKSLNQNSSLWDTYLNRIPKIGGFGLLIIFFFLLVLGLGPRFIYWQKSDILSTLPDHKTQNNGNNSKTNFASLLNMYEQIFNAIKIGKNPQLDRSESFQSLSTALQASRAEIRKILDDNQQLLTQLKDQNPQVVQEARQRDIYNQLKLFTTLNSAKIGDLPQFPENAEDYVSVTMLQEALKRGGYYAPTQEYTDEKGIWGQATKNAVRQAQVRANVPESERVDRVGPKTWGEIFFIIQDLQVEAVYQTLQTHLEQDNTNIVTEIRNCRDKHNDQKTPLHFNDCLEKIGENQANTDP